jgi:ribonuclease HII
VVAGVDEAGRGPLAGPVVAAAVILPQRRFLHLADSKQISPKRRLKIYQLIQRHALSIGVGIVDHADIDRLNILQATFKSMRLALAQLAIRPHHVLVDGYPIPNGAISQTGVIGGDGRSACVAAASIVAKVTRDSMMELLDRVYPGYGFKQHKGYGTKAHIERLRRLGPCAIHRRSFRPVINPSPTRGRDS